MDERQALRNDGGLFAGKRKLIVTIWLSMFIMGIATAMVFITRPTGAPVMDAALWVELARWIGGGGAAAFAVANGIEHLAGRRR
jgi:hypothetical protein